MQSNIYGIFRGETLIEVYPYAGQAKTKIYDMVVRGIWKNGAYTIHEIEESE